ncbi:MAG: ATP-binding cassette domain-containing protein, partial [Desulfonatronovibrionaceae bacterium]
MNHPDYLALENISKTYSVKSGSFLGQPLSLRALERVSLTIKKNETTGLVGESGCGKSTLGKISCGLESPTSGRIILKGTEIHSSSQILKTSSIQMIFQDPFSSLNPRQKIKNIIAEPLKIHKAGTRAEIRDRTLEISSRVGLSPKQLLRYPHEFSGGQRQRVAIARAMILNPGLVICDEPVSALDVSVQAQILKLLRNLQQDLGLSYLFISHDLSVVKYLCTRVSVMYLGELVEISTRNELFDHPCHPYT